MQRGILNSTHTGMTGTPAREMDYTLDIVGNWNAYLTKTGITTDLNQTRAQNKVNEITAIGTTGSLPLWATPAYDPAGNMTTMPQVADPTQSFTAVYDAWNRMVKVSDASGTVATYQYDGRNRRIVKNTTTPSETRHFYYTNNWQDIEEQVGTTTPTTDVQYVWGVRYIDELVCRDDATATPARRLYAMQDANFNLTGICDTGGVVQERYLFDPYGNRTIMNASWAVISSSAYAWVMGHQGLMHDSESRLIENRYRHLHPMLGRFGSRDFIWNADGANWYEYCQGSPIDFLDPIGLDTISGADFYKNWLQQNGIADSTGMSDTLSTGCIGISCLNLGLPRDPGAVGGKALNQQYPNQLNCYDSIEGALKRQKEMAEQCLCKDGKNMYGTTSRPMIFSIHYWVLGRTFVADPKTGYFTKFPFNPNTEETVMKFQGKTGGSFDYGWYDTASKTWQHADTGNQAGDLTKIQITSSTLKEWQQHTYDKEAFCVACENWQFPNKANPATTQPTTKPKGG